jgi:hypothetical protein
MKGITVLETLWLEQVMLMRTVVGGKHVNHGGAQQAMSVNVMTAVYT